jgi:hypothetical protein
MKSDTNATTMSVGVDAAPLARRTNWTANESPSTAIVQLVAEVTNRSHTDLDPLQETIDGDALNSLFESAASERLYVSFTYEGVNVRVTNDGIVEIWE